MSFLKAVMDEIGYILENPVMTLASFTVWFSIGFGGVYLIKWIFGGLFS